MVTRIVINNNEIAPTLPVPPDIKLADYTAFQI